MTARDRKVIIVVCVLVAVVGSWLLVIQPKRDQAAKLGDQVKTAQSQLDSARTQVAAGESAKGNFASSYTSLVKLGEAVPVDDNVPSLIYQLQGAASAAHVDFRSLNLTPGSGGSTPTPTASAKAATGTSSSSAGSSSAAPSSTASPSSSASSPSAAQASTAALPPGATVGPAGFPIEPFTFTFRGNFFHLADFFGRLERFVVASNKRLSVSGRLMTLNAISLGPGPAGFPQITASIAATTYLVPASQGLMNGASPAGPASGATAVSTASTSTTTPAAAVTPPVK